MASSELFDPKNEGIWLMELLSLSHRLPDFVTFPSLK